MTVMPDQDAALRQRYAEAIREHWLDNSNLDGSPSGSTFCVCGKWYELDKQTWDDHLADAVAAVRDGEIAVLRQQVEQLRYERQLLGAARMTLDLVAAGDPSRWDQVRQGAEDVFHRHRFEPLDVQHVRYTMFGQGQATLILKRCRCGANDTETVEGHWPRHLFVPDLQSVTERGVGAGSDGDRTRTERSLG